MSRRGEPGIARKEARSIRRHEQVHVRGTPPGIVAVAIASMFRLGRVDLQSAEVECRSRIDPDSLPVAALPKPLLHGAGCIDRNILPKCRQAREGQVIRMRMRHEYG